MPILRVLLNGEPAAGKDRGSFRVCVLPTQCLTCSIYLKKPGSLALCCLTRAGLHRWQGRGYFSIMPHTISLNLLPGSCFPGQTCLSQGPLRAEVHNPVHRRKPAMLKPHSLSRCRPRGKCSPTCIQLHVCTNSLDASHETNPKTHLNKQGFSDPVSILAPRDTLDHPEDKG